MSEEFIDAQEIPKKFTNLDYTYTTYATDNAKWKFAATARNYFAMIR